MTLPTYYIYGRTLEVLVSQDLASLKHFDPVAPCCP